MLGQQIALPESKPDTKTLLRRKGVGGESGVISMETYGRFFH